MKLRPSQRQHTILLVLSIALCYSVPTFSQTNKQLGTWNILTLQLPGGQRGWGGFLEAQARMNGLFREFNYHEYKGGISYDINKNFTLLLGVGRYTTFDAQELSATPLVREIRLWQQLTQSQSVGRLRFEHRYRVEQRWLDRRGVDQYRNRIRYRLNIQLPINRPKVEAKTLFISTYNEIFLNPNLTPFERNRLYAGLGYDLNTALVVQAGWLNQYDYTPTSMRHKNNLVFTVLYRFHRLKPGVIGLPTPVD